MSFELFDVKVLDESEPLARGLRSDLGYLDRHLKGRMRAPVQGVTPRIGTVPVDDVYIYPGIFYEKAEPTSMTPEQITQKALELMSRTGTVQPSDVRLRDGETIQGFPVGIELMNNVMTIKFAVDHASTLRAYPINEIAEIR